MISPDTGGGFDTETSALRLGKFNDPQLLDAIVKYARPLLEKKPNVKMFGKSCRMQRNVGFFSDKSAGYSYARQISASQSLTEDMRRLISEVNKAYGTEYNGILFNEYTNGSDYISAHSDSEDGIGTGGVVAISWGATRKFRVRKKDTPGFSDHVMQNYSMLHMAGAFQKEYTHEVPIERKVTGTRVSLTFRAHNK